MFDRFLDFLNRLPGAETGQDGSNGDDPRVAAAALLTHIMDADGEQTESERTMLSTLLSQTYGISGSDLEKLLAAGEEAHRDAVDLYAFTSVLNRHLDREGKLELIALMWDLVYSDGSMHEIEDNIVWRVAELIHVERDVRVALRLNARAKAGIDENGDGND
jgi:uncharacterized tellurite resistance protein B-like protein